jgi:chromosomal replication initiator protein
MNKRIRHFRYITHSMRAEAAGGITLETVKKEVCRYFEISPTDLESACREQPLAYWRQIAMYLCRTLTGQSLPQIGRAFGDRDHTTVLYAFRKIQCEVDVGVHDLVVMIVKLKKSISQAQRQHFREAAE